MPLSFGEWSSRDGNQAMNYEQPCFSRGTVVKRKLTGGDDMEWPMDDTVSWPEKRLCLIPENPFISQQPILPQGAHGINQGQPEENNNNNNNNNNNSNQNFMESHDMEMISHSHNQIVPDIINGPVVQTDDLIMDINDDDQSYSTPPNSQADQSAPPTPFVSQSQIVGSSHRQVSHAQFCRDFCGSGTVSPRSGHVRCYCKPSWEGMMGINAYFSDIY